MARAQGTNARTQRLTALVATVLLATATGFAIGRVFVDHASTYRMVVAGIVSAVIAVALERRSLVLATVVSVCAMIAVVGFMVFPATTWHGVPTLETIRAMLDAAGLVGEQARLQVAPTEPLPPLMLAALTATWASIFSAHALAFRAGSPILALLPPIALVAFADNVLEEIVRPLYGVGFLVAATALIFADGLRRVHGWGPVWTGPGREARLTITAGRGARRVAAATIALAAASPLLVPGFGSTAVLDLSSSGGNQVRLNPLVSVGASLQRDDPLPVFDVETSSPSYWRMVALPDFDGTTWTPDEDAQEQEVTDGVPLTVDAPAGAEVTQRTVTTSFRTTGDLELPWLPAPYPAVSTTLEPDDLRWDPEAGALTLLHTVPSGTSYSITAQLVRPTAGELRAESIPDPASVDRYLRYPEDLSPRIGQLAQEWTAGAGSTTYDKAIALQEHFASTGGFTYDDQVERRDDEQALQRFLTVTKAGFCQQFASAMAIMLRTLDIPARVAIGYTTGSFDDDQDVLHVTTDQAHAWVEVYFPTYGWLTFDPTPNRADVVAYPYLDPSPSRPGCSGGPRCNDPGGSDGKDVGGKDRPLTSDIGLTAIKEAGFGDRSLATTPDTAAGLLPDQEGAISPRMWLAVLALAAVVVLALMPPFRALRRRRRLHKAAKEPRALILATYDVFTERAAELGFPRAPGQTVREYRESVRTGSGMGEDDPGFADLRTLSALTSDAAYAPGDPSPDEASEATRAATHTLHALRRKAGWLTRFTGMYRRG